MKYCTRCGSQLDDDVIICPYCGENAETHTMRRATTKGMNIVEIIAFVFMILSCVAAGWLLIPLIWMIPMTVKYYNACEKGERVSTGFGVCTLLFVNLVSGILMLIDE